MSNFEDNPFSDPTIDNPFADPSVQQVARSTNNAAQGLDDYNPFDGQQNANQTAPQQSQPAIMQAVSPPPPSGGFIRPQQQPQAAAAPPANFTTADFQRRQEELERKAEELARREAELRAGSAGRRNNWPPLPSFCPVQPCFYQDINVDIPLEFQRIVRHLYHLWMFHALLLSLNMLGTMAIMFAGLGFNPFGLSILYFVLLTPFSFVCWYRPIYKVSLYILTGHYRNMLGTVAIMFAGLGFNPFGLSILYFVLLTPFSFVCCDKRLNYGKDIMPDYSIIQCDGRRNKNRPEISLHTSKK
ncbi:SCAMP family domain-containing protein [Phthorimaea operculella]|nr:SCAMP family domain-containing protein [Phthorimaea operculella]